MLNIRFGAFETNSSSVHSLIMCSAEEYEKLKNGELYIDDGWRGVSLLTKEEAAMKLLDVKRGQPYTLDSVMALPNEELIDLLANNEIYTLESYWDEHAYMEGYVEYYTTPGGEGVVAFGYYGHD